MRPLPFADPGMPDARTPTRYLLWLARGQWTTLAAGVVFGILWMGSQALVPLVIGKAIDAGVASENRAGLIVWTGAVLGLGAVSAIAGVLRHRFVVVNWLSGAYRTIQIVVRHATTVGASLPQHIATGEVVSIGTTDISHVGGALEITARASGAVVAFVLVAVILLSSSTALGLLVLVGVPLLTLAITPLLRPLHRRQHELREEGGQLTTVASDIVAGLRVLRGIGGEETFANQFRLQSQRVRQAGLGVARVDAYLDGAQVLLPGIFVVLVTWLGARLTLDGQISIGELVAFYGYAAFLVGPLRTATEAADKITRGMVAARRIVRLLAVQSALADGAPVAEPPGGPARHPAPQPIRAGDSNHELLDKKTSFVVSPGMLTAVAASDPADASALADRLGRYINANVLWRGVPLDQYPLAIVRERILVADTDARLFSGRLRDELDVRGDRSTAEVINALHTASAEDILDTLADGLDEHIQERGRSFSGGERQRLVLARALLADPDVLILVEPTSAVDAHTEARIMRRLGPAREGRTTVVMSTSPLVLDRADAVAFLQNGLVRAVGTHRRLLDEAPDYRTVVTREEDE